MSLSISLSLLLIFISHFPSSNAEPFIGVNYGQVADNLPSPSKTAKLLKTTSIQKVRLYGADPTIFKALAITGVGIIIGAANEDVPSLAADPNATAQWINSNVLPFYPSSNIILITVGVNVEKSESGESVAPGDAKRTKSNRSGISRQENQGIDGARDVDTRIIVSAIYRFVRVRLSNRFKRILQFLSETGSHFAINPYRSSLTKVTPGLKRCRFACFSLTSVK
ncbi:unnamed protein product [Cochlearia groenlandica]